MSRVASPSCSPGPSCGSWPPERFFWTRLDAPGWRTSGPVLDGLREALADDLPIPAESVWAVGTPVGDGTAVVCAAPRAALDNLERATLTLTPSAVPAELGATCDPEHLNLLVGEYEPRVVRRARSRTRVLIVMSIAACLGLMASGLARRAAAWREEALATERVTEQVTQAALLSGGKDLATEAARLRELIQARSGSATLTDASSRLAAILQGWPATVACVAHSITINEAGATVSLSVGGDPTPFLQAIRPPAGWVVDEPRINAASERTRVSVRLRPAKGSANDTGEPL